MRLRMSLILCLLLVGTLLMMPHEPVVAQDACPALVQTALEQMGQNCSGVGLNNACYGYTRVDSTFVVNTPVDFFSQPSDQAELAQIETISTQPLDLNLDQWGIALMNLRANVPGALPGQASVFMLMGDTEIDNAVAPDDTLPEADPVETRTTAEAGLVSGPSATANRVALLASGVRIQAEGISPDGDWLRVYSEAGLGWVRRTLVSTVAGLDALPTVSANQRPPMQSFQVRTAFNDLLCNEAPSLLAIQSPEGIKVDLTANGANIRLGSLIMLRTLPPGDVLQVITIEGDVTLEPGTSLETHLAPGYATQRCLDADGNVSDSCGWTTPVPLTEQELTFAQTVLLAFQGLHLENGDSLAIGGDQIRLIDTNACPAGATVEYTVQRGDSLSVIALQYGTSVNALVFGNDLESTTILPGQKLSVICGARGPVSLPSLGAPPLVVDEPPQAPATDCSGFAATSPLDGLKYGENTFYWNAPNTSVEQYRVTVSGETGSLSETTGGENLNLTANLVYDTVGSGYQFSWKVEALVNGEAVCSTPTTGINRESPPPFKNSNSGSDNPEIGPTPDPECEPICEGDYCYYPCEDYNYDA